VFAYEYNSRFCKMQAPEGTLLFQMLIELADDSWRLAVIVVRGLLSGAMCNFFKTPYLLF
jgi:hypothetical protein